MTTRRVRSTVSIRLFIVTYRSDLVRVRVLLLLPPPMTTPTPTPLSYVIVESILNWIRMHLSRRLTFLLYVSVTILSIGLSVRYYNVSIARGTVLLIFVFGDGSDLVKRMYRYFDPNKYNPTTMIWYTIRHQDPLNRLIKK